MIRDANDVESMDARRRRARGPCRVDMAMRLLSEAARSNVEFRVRLKLASCSFCLSVSSWRAAFLTPAGRLQIMKSESSSMGKFSFVVVIVVVLLLFIQLVVVLRLLFLVAIVVIINKYEEL